MSEHAVIFWPWMFIKWQLQADWQPIKKAPLSIWHLLCSCVILKLVITYARLLSRLLFWLAPSSIHWKNSSCSFSPTSNICNLKEKKNSQWMSVRKHQSNGSDKVEADCQTIYGGICLLLVPVLVFPGIFPVSRALSPDNSPQSQNPVPGWA